MGDLEIDMFPSVKDGANAAGALVESPNYIPSATGTLIYFECNDIFEESARIEPAGGKIVKPKTSLGPSGY